MVESGLNLIMLIITLGIVVAISFNLIIPVVNETDQFKYKQIYDKTADKIYGEKVLSSEDDEYYTASEIVLMIMGQNYFMPEPGKIEIAGEEIGVSNNVSFSPKSKLIGDKAKDAIISWYSSFRSSYDFRLYKDSPTSLSNAKFKIMYCFNDGNNTQDDTYSLYIRLTKEGEDTQPKYYRCLSGGRLGDIGGNWEYD